MDQRNYICEKITIAIICLCGEGTFNSRLENATISALCHLDSGDINEEWNDRQKETLNSIFKLTTKNIIGGKIQKELNEVERKNLIEKLISLLNVNSEND